MEAVTKVRIPLADIQQIWGGLQIGLKFEVNAIDREGYQFVNDAN